MFLELGRLQSQKKVTPSVSVAVREVRLALALSLLKFKFELNLIFLQPNLAPPRRTAAQPARHWCYDFARTLFLEQAKL